MTMLGLEVVFLVGLCVLAPVVLFGPVRDWLFKSGRETFHAYYVAWLYGPLGWGLYRKVRWAQIVGVGIALVVVLTLM